MQEQIQLPAPSRSLLRLNNDGRLEKLNRGQHSLVIPLECIDHRIGFRFFQQNGE